MLVRIKTFKLNCNWGILLVVQYRKEYIRAFNLFIKNNFLERLTRRRYYIITQTNCYLNYIHYYQIRNKKKSIKQYYLPLHCIIIGLTKMIIQRKSVF